MDWPIHIMHGLLAAAAGESSGILPLDVIWEHITQLDIVDSVTFISFGVVCLLYGWRVFKVLVTICFALIGLILSAWINETLVGGEGVWLALIVVTFFAILSVSLMRWGVCALGALSGGILTTAGWLALGLPQSYFWAGSLVGLIAGGMISFIVFKVAVILFTSLGGSTLITVGSMAIVYDYMDVAERLKSLVFDYPWFLPVVVLVPMIVGIVLQYQFIKGAQDWTV